MNKALEALTKDAAILLYMVIGWSVPILRGGTFAPLRQEGNLASLAVLILVWLSIYLAHYLQTGDWTPPPPVADERRFTWKEVEHALVTLSGSTVFHLAEADCKKLVAAIVAALGRPQPAPLPPSPPAAPPAATVP